MWNKQTVRRFVFYWISLALLMAVASCVGASYAADLLPPPASVKYRATLTRAAHQVWGLNAPIPMFAAQIHQESLWQPNAVSHVGARGMAQFMPQTATWWCDLNDLNAQDCQPNNPIWAMHALVGYDRYLWERTWGLTEYDHIYAVLRSYNGGLGNWLQEVSIAQSKKRELIDAACGKARRHIKHCKENLSYPKRILNVHQPRYFGWGRGIFIMGGTA